MFSDKNACMVHIVNRVIAQTKTNSRQDTQVRQTAISSGGDLKCNTCNVCLGTSFKGKIIDGEITEIIEPHVRTNNVGT